VCIVFWRQRKFAIDEFHLVLYKESTLTGFAPRLIIATYERRRNRNNTRMKVIQRGNNGARITIFRVLRSS